MLQYYYIYIKIYVYTEQLLWGAWCVSEWNHTGFKFNKKREEEIPTLWSRGLLEELIISHLVNKFPISYEILRSIIMFARSSHWTLSWSKWIQSTSLNVITLGSVLVLSSNLRFSFQGTVWIFYLSTCYTPSPSHPPSFDHSNIQRMEL